MKCINCFPASHCVYFGNRPICYYKKQCIIEPCPIKPEIPIQILDPGQGGIGPVVRPSNSPAIMSYSYGPSCFAHCMQITGDNFYACQNVYRPIYQ